MDGANGMPSYGLNIGYQMDHLDPKWLGFDDLLGTPNAPVSKIPSVNLKSKVNSTVAAAAFDPTLQEKQQKGRVFLPLAQLAQENDNGCEVTYQINLV